MVCVARQIVLVSLDGGGMDWRGMRHACVCERDRGACRILVAKPERQKPLARHRCRWEDNIKMDIEEIIYKSMNWIHKARNTDK